MAALRALQQRAGERSLLAGERRSALAAVRALDRYLAAHAATETSS